MKFERIFTPLWLAIILVSLFLCALLFYPFKVRVLLYAEVLTQTFAFSLVLAGISVYAAKLHITDDGLFTTAKNGKIKSLKIDISKQAANAIYSKLKQKELTVSFYGGIKDDEYRSCMLCGAASSAAAAAAPVFHDLQTHFSTNIIKTGGDALTIAAEFNARISVLRTLIAWALKI